MNFEINSYENNDRATDGNDLQNIGSRGGEGGLFGRVPGRPQVGTANRSQGQAHDGPGQDQGRPLGLGDQGLPLEGKVGLKPMVG